MTTAIVDVLVVGAGPTGLMMADLLIRNGVSVRIFDKKPGPSQETRAIAVHSKTLELWDKLDLAGQAVAEGERFDSFRLFRQGRPVGKLALLNSAGRRRAPYPFGLIYGQEKTEQMLIANLAAAGSQVEWNTVLLNVVQTPERVQTCLRTADGREETVEARWLIGADGAHSPVRHALSLGFAGETYMQSLFVADLDVKWDLAKQQGGMDLARHGFFLFVPYGAGRYRLFGTLPPELAERETITLDEVRQVLDTQSGLRLEIPHVRWISVYRTHLRMAEHFRVGRAFLLGDAAHIHSPAGGQGMNTGIGDAFNLAWKLALVIKGQAHEQLLDSYEAERMPFARAILRGSDLGFHIMAATNPLLQRTRLYVVPLLLSLVTPLPFLRRRLFWFLSQLWTSYRGSPAVVQVGSSKQEPYAGERAPYGFFEAGPDAGRSIFSLLKGVDHHLLLFAGRGERSASATKLQALTGRLQALLDVYSVPVCLHMVPRGNLYLHKQYGADLPMLFLVRPDGQIAYRGPAEDLAAFKAYLDLLFVTSHPHEA